MSDNELFWPAWGDDPHDPANRPTTPIATHADSSQSFGPYLPGEPQSPARRRPSWLAPAAAAGAAALVFGGVGVGIGTALDDDSSAAPAGDGFTVAGSPVSTGTSPRSFAAIAAKVLPSVVSINVRGSSGSDTGSGVVLRSDGYVLTNNHVVAAAASGGSVSVVFNDGSTSSARIVGTDQEDDLAVIKVAKTGLPAATLGASSNVRVGDAVLAVGSPLGLTGTVTAGIVSALNRPVDTTQDQQQQTDPFSFNNQQQQTATTTVISAIQTDAAINPGNSGGPLLNAAGQVIGINSAIASTGSIGGQAGNIGVGFAIPIDQARIIAGELIKDGKASHPLMGVVLADATDDSGNDLARVQSVTSGGPAAKAGLKVGDVIVEVGGQRTAGADAVIAAIRLHQPGQRLSITVERDGAKHTLTVTLADAAAVSP
jgi:putative serine protease PepD